jgi:N utilization substance protein A
MVVSELRGERIDIIPYHDDAARYVAKALSPARVREVLVDDEDQSATIIVPDDQLSLAIGREGQNARLASKLTGWRIDIRSQQQQAEAEADMDFAEEEGVAGQCMAVTATGKRCPNQAVAGSRYCSIHADYVEPETPAGDEAGDEAETATTDEPGAPAAADAAPGPGAEAAGEAGGGAEPEA